MEVTVALSEPDSIWPYAAATNAGAISSKAFLEKHGKNVGTPQVGIIGTGPYKYVSWTPGQQVVLERSSDYWDKTRQPKIQRVVFNILAAETTIVEALATGAVDGTFASSSLSGRNIVAVSKLSNVNVYSGPSFTVHYVIINTQRKPFNDPRVRQALSYAIDKVGILASVWAGQGSLSKSPAPPSLFSYDQGEFQSAYNALPGFTKDIAKGVALVKAAGATGSTASIMVGTDFEENSALLIQAAGKAIGLNLTINKVNDAQKQGEEFSGKPRTYDLSVSEWGSDIPDPAGNIVLPFYSGNPVTDDSQYHNPKVDKLLQAARAESVATRRAQLLAQAQSLIVNDQPWIVLYSPHTQIAYNKRLGGYQPRPLWYWDAWATDIGGK
jgi:peptide/nickel transport system substrate-binding protein